MAQIRKAGADDAPILADHRVRMFADAGLAIEAEMTAMRDSFVSWVGSRLEDSTYIGWIAEQDGTVHGGAGVWIMDWPPHYLHVEARRAYLLNFYVAPEARRQGLARQLLEIALDEVRSRGIAIATLHASKFGRPLDEQYGFKPSNEMMLRMNQGPESAR